MAALPMTYLFAVLQGAGTSAGVGVRPFLPALLAGALASANLGVDYDHTDFSFLESPWFLLALVVATAVTILFRARVETGAGESALQGIAVGLGALEFAGTLDDVSGTWWPGLIGGVLCATLGASAARGLLGRVRRRLDSEAAAALFLYADAFGLLLVGLSIAFPPLALVGLAALAWLLLGSRRREGEKYAGLRLLR